MAITGDRFIGTYEGHTIELVRDNLRKTLALHIDGAEVARESRALPHSITLTGTLDHAGTARAVVARSVVHFPSTEDTVTVNGDPLPLTKVR